MRVVVIADIHSNLVALEAVLAHAEDRGPIDQLWVLGDLVGYGPRPNECISRLKEYKHLAVAGNHDKAAIGQITTADFNPYAAAAASWTAETISPDSSTYLTRLPEVTKDDVFTLVHGTLRDPIWEYLYTVDVAAEHLKRQKTAYSFVGHTHVPMVVHESRGKNPVSLARLESGESVALEEERLVINPGSAGQPRDGDPRVCYGVLDTGAATFTQYRIEYDIMETQKQMKAEGLPQYLIERLARGR
jgi:predicted phosphodiesterase